MLAQRHDKALFHMEEKIPQGTLFLLLLLRHPPENLRTQASWPVTAEDGHDTEISLLHPSASQGLDLHFDIVSSAAGCIAIDPTGPKRLDGNQTRWLSACPKTNMNHLRLDEPHRGPHKPPLAMTYSRPSRLFM